MFNPMLRLVRTLVDGVIIVLYGFMCLAILFQVLGRYLFGFSIGEVAEAATFAQVWMVMLAAGVAMRLNMHNAMDLLSRRFPRPVYRGLLLVSTTACLGFLAATFSGSLPLLKIGQFQISPALQVHMAYAYYAIPAGCVYFALEILLGLAQRWNSDPAQLSPSESEA